jgi:hypothetical protein
MLGCVSIRRLFGLNRWARLIPEYSLSPGPYLAEALRIIGSKQVLKRLVDAARTNSNNTDWVIATLGRLPANEVKSALAGDRLLDRLQPLLLLSNSTNWIAEDAVDIDLKFLLKQHL